MIKLTKLEVRLREYKEQSGHAGKICSGLFDVCTWLADAWLATSTLVSRGGGWGYSLSLQVSAFSCVGWLDTWKTCLCTNDGRVHRGDKVGLLIGARGTRKVKDWRKKVAVKSGLHAHTQ